jgi:uncharacterized protein (DUF983 family)
MSQPNYLFSTLTNKCPRCRQGNIFESKNAYNLKNTMKMPENCPVCGQPTELEVGFYYGTGYVSYALSIAFTVAYFIAWKVLIGMTFDIEDNRILYWLGSYILVIVLFQPLIMRLSRSIWLSWFVKYDPDWVNHPLTNDKKKTK